MKLRGVERGNDIRLLALLDAFDNFESGLLTRPEQKTFAAASLAH